jgi:hypothetical protein
MTTFTEFGPSSQTTTLLELAMQNLVKTSANKQALFSQQNRQLQTRTKMLEVV